ncbi:sulfatase family protein [Marinilabilia rubra]|uniref:Sulfatase n=1 Tax=Marinilabilia rubra TaxID=2162893 RepID=A0A2U2BBE9_9BACT|nr:arylsulfatase [Marinilabilia rubra]PWE00388.1 sulfatase [Marinilabilia rubra]
MKVINLICSVLVIFMLTTGCSNKKSDNKTPNIVVILADDLGYGDIKAYNSESQIPTPNLDRLAKEGLSFTDAHTNSAVCTPTRYGLLTGRYAFRTRLKSGVLVGHDPALIAPDRTTIGSLLQKAGYTTACVGKWHLGLDWAKKDSTQPLWHGGNAWDMQNTSNVDYAARVGGGPADRGFDYSFIIPASLDIAPYTYIEDGYVTAPVNDHVPFYKDTTARGIWYRHGDVAEDFDHKTVLQTITQNAVDFINQKAREDKPFMIYLPFTSPHTPWFPSEKYKGISEAGVYGDFVAMTDGMVGKVMKALDQKGITKNTLVIFTSDNGSHWLDTDIKKFSHRANDAFKGMKSDVWEGGHRVPFIVRWPEQVKGGRTSPTVICTTDLLATLAEITNQKLDAGEGEDSFSFLSALKGEEPKPVEERTIIHHSVNGTFAIRSGKWKYIDAKGSGGWSLPEKQVPGDAPAAQLYDMSKDSLEQNNLIAEEPEVAARMKKILEEYKTEARE